MKLRPCILLGPAALQLLAGSPGVPAKSAALGRLRVTSPSIQAFTCSPSGVTEKRAASLLASYAGTGASGWVQGTLTGPDGTKADLGGFPIASGVPRSILLPFAGQADFTLTVSGALGSVTQSLNVKVSRAAPVLGSFEALPGPGLTQGETAYLHFTLDGQGGMPTTYWLTLPSGENRPLHAPPLESELTIAPDQTGSYALSVSNDGGQSTRSLQIQVLPPPRIDRFFAAPSRVNPGEGTTLYSGFSNGKAMVYPLVGALAGERVDLPSLGATTDFSLTVTNPLGRQTNARLKVYAASWHEPAGQPLMARFGGHQLTPLLDGQVLVTGGDSSGGVLDTAELFDPKTKAFRLTGRMTQARRGHTATLLDNGKVLIAGGLDAFGSPLRTAEVYDPSTHQFTPTAQPMLEARAYQAATAVPGGVVLVGGSSGDYFDLQSGTFLPTGSLNFERKNHTVTALQDRAGKPTGAVLVVGGDGPSPTAEVMDIKSMRWRVLASQPSCSRSQHSALALPDGNVLLAGGFDAMGTALWSLEIYDPVTQSFLTAGGLNTLSGAVQASLLPDGAVLFTHPSQNAAEFCLRGTPSARMAVPKPESMARGVAAPYALDGLLMVGVDPQDPSRGRALIYE